MGAYNVFPSFIAGQEARRAADEANYIDTRRAIEDPLKDKANARVDSARDAIVGEYGVQAGDPTSYNAVRGEKRAEDLHPLEMKGKELSNESQGITNTGAKADNTAKIDERTRAASGRMLAGLANSGASNADEAEKYFAGLSPDILAASGTDPAKIPDLIAHLREYPDFKQGVNALRHAMGTPERVTSVVAGIDPKTGKPINYGVGDDQSPGAITGVAPDDRMHGLQMENQRLSNDYLRAQTGYMDERTRGGGAGAAKATTPEQAAAGANALQGTINDMRTQLNDAVQSGAITDSGPDGNIIDNLFSGDNPAGRFLGGLTGDPKEAQRKKIDDTSTMLLTSLINSPGMSSRLFDSNAEKETWLAMLGKSGSYEARVEAINKFERFAHAKLADPARIGRPSFDTPGATGAPGAPGAPGAAVGSAVSPDRRAQLDAMYGRD